MVALVPLRLLYRNSELAATIFILNVILKNIDTVVLALIWRNDDMESWWKGYGLCDVTPYFHNFSIALYATCLLAIMRNLAHQVGLLTAHPLTVKEKRKRNMIQALIMFPLPVVQLALTWPLTRNRYAVGAIVGCSWSADPSWPYLVFFVIAPTIVSTITVFYAILIYWRFRQVSTSNASILSSNRLATQRANRTRRRLYLMVISVLIPVYPMMLLIFVLNILDMGPATGYSYERIHAGLPGLPWNSIMLLPSSSLNFAVMNVSWLTIISCGPIFMFFGCTKDAINDYRIVLLKLGLGKIWPKLNQEYAPDRPAGWSQGSCSQGTSRTGSTNPKAGTSVSSHPLSTFSSSSRDTEQPHAQSLNFLTSTTLEAGPAEPSARQQDEEPTSREPVYDHILHRNPFLMRTNLSLPPLSFLQRSKKRVQSPQDPTSSNGIYTSIWSSDDESRGPDTDDNNDGTQDTRGVQSTP
ncbi:uncharacterized protein J7T54_003260 [Emericellopsis cladophorae]|uniref:Pheromone a factor receptor n=1 Tax=Emericellopsis cladophorae TaxID=2686198 RepID=A0A9P9Y022_9HYPO|nr:uncharacterized protein J7T54_003260 [Emericellopsis cladophorae]KAI6781093.1 hypothetical protein J7T54_003260 [Emericellopsis cladophorae]